MRNAGKSPFSGEPMPPVGDNIPFKLRHRRGVFIDFDECEKCFDVASLLHAFVQFLLILQTQAVAARPDEWLLVFWQRRESRLFLYRDEQMVCDFADIDGVLWMVMVYPVLE